MPKSRFEFIEGMSQPAIFADMTDRDEAVREAKRAAKEAMLDGIVDGVDPTSWVTKVYDEAGYLVARQLSDAASPVRTSPHQLDLKRDAQPQNPVAVFVPHFNKHLLPSTSVSASLVRSIRPSKPTRRTSSKPAHSMPIWSLMTTSCSPLSKKNRAIRELP
ncbi:hypothetical protein LB579_33850 [Mesorhizobium sp. BR1-1-7]|nr:hypothetical protein [Mesorhizobium sp. BR1-1-7]MBZ9922643.1 hypothetical protein [Mesorhizobium sp. BR1-1-7]